MNEHIKALAEQATEYATTRHPTSNTVLSINSEKFEQKFAELLVQECATYLNVAVEVHNQNEQDVCDRAARAIKRYFGVDK